MRLGMHVSHLVEVVFRPDGIEKLAPWYVVDGCASADEAPFLLLHTSYLSLLIFLCVWDACL